MGCKVSLIHSDPDGSFPNGIVNPAREETVKNLEEEVIKQKADIGIALDVDGDRVCFIDEKGSWTQGDVAFAIIAASILEKNKNAEVVADIRTSRAVIEYLKELGGRIRFSKVGHSYIANAVIDSEAKIGGELSGHIYIHDKYYGYDDGIYAAVRMIETLARNEETLSEAKSKLRKMSSSPEIRIEFPDELKFNAVAKISEILKRQGLEVNELDGVRVDFKSGWFSIRASNTEPCLVLRMEGDDEKSLQEMTSRAYGLVSDVGHQLGYKPNLL
jgi:phosphomannomutase